MTGHRVRIGALRTEIGLVAAPAAVAPLRASLDRTLTEDLPPLLAEATGPVLDGRDGVVRIRRLRVTVGAGLLDPAALARLLAARIAGALGEALSGPATEVRVWASHEAYLTSYVEAVLGLEPQPLWPFADLAALRLLAPTEAAVEVLRARPGLLVRLAEAGARVGDPARLLAVFDDAGCAALLDALLGPDPASFTPEDVAALLPDLPAAPLAPGSVPRATLVALLRTLARRPVTDVAGPVHAAVAAAVLVALPPSSRAALVVPGVPPEPAAVLAAEWPGLPERLRRTVLDAVTMPPVRAALADLLHQAQVVPRAPAPANTVPPEKRDRSSPARPLSSPVAGAVLLLPGAARLARSLTAGQLRAAVLSALDAGDDTATDPLLAILLPVEPHESLGEVPAVPRSVLDGLRPESRPLVGHVQGAERWGQALLADFAGRLPGLAHSSPAYLRRQFLHIPGRLDATGDELTVTLDGPPLAVVLAMAGYSGDQGPMPRLGDRRLAIVLTGLRP
ncbi:hypothetical protein AB0J83_44195 [Actinoplanes sp. NPDC049596]|uniref:hypothetical protein n=1 Tax=unclassified Actinoplanes TaxID=2626549 RepID=UPI00343C4490